MREPTYSTLSLTVQGATATLTLARPQTGNALGALGGKDLRRAVEAVAADPAIRLLVLRAEGKAFCVGGDLGEFASQTDLGPAVRAMVVDFHAACLALSQLRTPILCVVQGAAAGAGLALIGLSDYVIASASAKFTYAYPSVGLSADGGVTWLLPRLMGPRAFSAFALTGKTLTSSDALDQGLVSEVVDDERLAQAAEAVAHKLVSSATSALGAIRTLAIDGLGLSYEAHLSSEMEEVSTLAGGATAQAAISDVLNRRAPSFPER